MVTLIPGPSHAWSLSALGSLAFIRGWLMARKIGQGRCGIETSVRFIPNYLICLPPLLFMAGIYRAISGARQARTSMSLEMVHNNNNNNAHPGRMDGGLAVWSSPPPVLAAYTSLSPLGPWSSAPGPQPLVEFKPVASPPPFHPVWGLQAGDVDCRLGQACIGNGCISNG